MLNTGAREVPLNGCENTPPPAVARSPRCRLAEGYLVDVTSAVVDQSSGNDGQLVVTWTHVI